MIDKDDLTIDEIEEIIRVMDSQEHSKPENKEDNTTELKIDKKGFFVKMSLKNKDVFLVSKEYVHHMDMIVGNLQKEIRSMRTKIYNLENNPKGNK